MKASKPGAHTRAAGGWFLVLAGGATVYAGIDIFLTADGWIFDPVDGVLIACAGAVMAVAGAVIIHSGRRLRDKD